MHLLLKQIKMPILALCLIALLCAAGCSKGNEGEAETISAVPSALAGSSFVYDELETGEGSSLYTLRFTDDAYYLYKDSGTGVLSYGTVEASADKGLLLHGEDGDLSGSYTGSAFEEASVTLEVDGKELKMDAATDTSEYVYLSYLGVYDGEADGETVTLVLERWFEYYLYSDGTLERGSYEIYSDGTLALTPYDGESYTASVSREEGENFSISEVSFSVPVNGEACTLSYAEPEESFEAEHAMGAYTLSIYKNNMFTIKGVDGFVKCLGLIEREDNEGTATYFARKITGDAEDSDKFRIDFTYDENTLYFPETTPLLPRSGNIDDETGLGSYWNAGTKLEFIRKAQTETSLNDGIEFVSTAVDGAVSGGNFPEEMQGLDQVMPSVGTAKPLVILVDFPDFHRPRHVTAEGIEEALFSLDIESSLAAYYYRSSYGQLTIDGTVLGWYRTKQNRGDYASDKEIMAEAINYYIEQGIDLTDYDGDGDGEIDSLYILWAGTLSSEGGSWDAAYRSTWDSSPAEWDCRVTGYIFVPGSTIWSSVPPLVCNTNSLIHETGHLLGLNDYYSYDTGERDGYTGGALEGGLGGMDMMDSNVGEHNAFSKWLLGWLEPEVITYDEISSLDGETFELKPSSLSGDAVFIQLKEADSLYTELLVIEAVAPEGNAAEYTRLTQPVVRILHVDTTVAEDSSEGGWRGFGFEYDNSYTSTKFISVVEADGEDEILNFVPNEDGTKLSYNEEDYFKAGDSISANTYPNTNAYDSLGNASAATGLRIDIEDIKEDGTAVIRLSYEEPAETLELEEISPEAQEVPYSEGEEKLISADTEEIRFSYSVPIEERENGLGEITVLCDQQEIEGFEASIEGNELVISFSNPLEEGKGYTVVIPQGTLQARGDESVINNFNGIYGFLTESLEE